VDADGDGVLSDDDCDDSNPDVNPGAQEVCDGVDNDCNGYTDEDDSHLDRSTMSDYYYDVDGDGWGNSDSIVVACTEPEGYGPNEGDCDETNPDINPGAEEVCDDIDNDCNGVVDDSATEGDWYYPDNDGDGIGALGEKILLCSGAELPLDCDDDDATEPQVVDITNSGLVAGTLAFPWTSIQDGIDAADECVIVFAGTYDEAIDFGGKDISVVGVEGAASTIIDASGLGTPGVTFNTGETSDAQLSGFTITGGSGETVSTTASYSCGSGVTCNEYTTSSCGGGIYVSGASPTLSSLILLDNLLSEASTTTSGNDTYYVESFGGGLCLQDGNVTLSYSEVRGNYANIGGGVYVDESSTLAVTGTWFVANGAADGGAAGVDTGTLSLTNVASVWNAASAEGGGAWIENGSLSASQVTWGEDDAPTGGVVSAGGTAAMTVVNSILYGSNTGACVNFADSAALTASYSDLYGCAGGNVTGGTDPTGSSGNVNEDPRFTSVTDNGDPDDDDWSLAAGSPAIDAGDPSTTDPDASVADMGAWGGAGASW